MGASSGSGGDVERGVGSGEVWCGEVYRVGV